MHWVGPTGGTARRTVLLGLTIDDAAALGSAVGSTLGVADDTYALRIDDLLPDGRVVHCFDDGDAAGALPGVTPYTATLPLLDDTLRVTIGPSASSVAATRAARLAATLSWGAPIVAAAGVGALLLSALRLRAQAAVTREALAASEATRDSIMVRAGEPRHAG